MLVQTGTMMRNRLFTMAACVVLTFALGSCSIAYTVEPVMRGDQLVFRFQETGWFGGRGPVSLQHLWVRRLSNDQPVMWEIESNEYNGLAMRELEYGIAGAGTTVRVEPERLTAGQVYQVEVRALGGSGSQQFVILPGPGPAQPISVLNR